MTSILYSIYAFKNRAQDISQTLSKKLNGNIRVNPYYSGNKSAIRLAIFKTLWIIRVLIIPLLQASDILHNVSCVTHLG